MPLSCQDISSSKQDVEQSLGKKRWISVERLSLPPVAWGRKPKGGARGWGGSRTLPMAPRHVVAVAQDAELLALPKHSECDGIPTAEGRDG